MCVFMRSPGLTREVAEEMIGAQLSTIEHTIRQKHPLVPVLKGAFAKKEELFQDGKLEQMSLGWVPTLEAVNDPLVRRSIELSTQAREQFLALLAPLASLQSESRIVWEPSADGSMSWQQLTFELLANALEHGSYWCGVGKVHFSVTHGTKGVMAVVKQPLRFTDFSFLDIEELRRRYDRTPRGAGLVHALKEETPYVCGCPLQKHGFETVVLETWARLEKLLRQMR